MSAAVMLDSDLHTRALCPGFGVEVLDLDLATLSEAQVPALLDALVHHALLLCRRQSLDDAQHAQLARTLGPVNVASRRSCLAPGQPEVMYVSNLHDEDLRLIGGLGKTDHSESVWHSDQSFRARPATLSTLFCVHAPATGGGTGIASSVLGHAALPAELQARVAGLTAIYRPLPGHEMEIIDVTHPAVLTNPVTGRKALYVSELCRGFVGMDEAQGLALRDELMGYILQPAHCYVHPWRMGDMLIYDNAQVLHRREGFAGLRWLKGTRSYAPTDRFAQP